MSGDQRLQLAQVVDQRLALVGGRMLVASVEADEAHSQ